MGDEAMQVEEVRRLLRAAVRLQMRSVLETTLIGGRAMGLQLQGVAAKLEVFCRSELDDLRLLVEKLAAIGGDPPSDVAPLAPVTGAAEDIKTLIAHEEECLEALHSVIPPTGQEPRSEAMEHLMEHVIMRKQNQVDYLRRAVGELEES